MLATVVDNPHPLADIAGLSACALSDAIHRREVSCEETMQAYLAQVDSLNPVVNALVALQPRDTLLQQAAAADSALARGEVTGWMHGFPQAPKDIPPLAGMVTTRGSRIHRGRVTTTDSLVFSRMRKAGAIFIGRSNTPEFGLGSHTYNGVYGLTRNAFDQSRSAGGSSGGAAVAVALGMLPVADGSDMMGSLRNPAGWNNIFGFRPSFGRVPGWPSEDVFYAQFSTGGPMARNVPDLAMLLSVQVGGDERVPLSNRQPASVFTQNLQADLKGTRIGWLGDFSGYLAMDSGVLEVCESALVRLRAAGCQVETARTPFPMERVWESWCTLRSFNAAGVYGTHYDKPEERDLLKPEAVWEIEQGRALSPQDIHRAMISRSAWYQEMLRLFGEFDYLALPSAQVFPFDHQFDWPPTVGGRAMDTYHRWMEVVIPATMAGLPALCVPAGFNADGLPMGLQLIGRPRADFETLQLGHAYEQVNDRTARRSPLLAAQ